MQYRGSILLSGLVKTVTSFRTYCNENAEVNTNNFLSFGDGHWNDPQTSQGQFIDTRDQQIVEADDGHFEITLPGMGWKFGNDRKFKICVSSNGPVYFDSCSNSAQKIRNEWSPKSLYQSSFTPEDSRWTGISGVWDDLVAFESVMNPRDGGNVYYRKVSYEDTITDARAKEDFRRAYVSLNLYEASIDDLIVITFHKMAQQNSKFECGVGVTFQYLLARQRHSIRPNPFIAVNYGEFEWVLHNAVMGINLIHTRQNKILDFSEYFGSGMNAVESSTISCDGDTCQQSYCQGQRTYIKEYDQIVCESDDINRSTLIFEYEGIIKVDQENCNQEQVEQSLVDVYLERNFENGFYSVSVIDFSGCEEFGEVKVSIKLAFKISDPSELGVETAVLKFTDLTRGKFLEEPAEMISAVFKSGQFVDTPQNFIKFYEGISLDGYSIDVLCKFGYEKVESQSLQYPFCKDIDECETPVEGINMCSSEGNCRNLIGSYTCECPNGYAASGSYFEGFVCTNVDECLENLHDCDLETSTCQDTNGSYECPCLPGFAENTFNVCTRNSGYEEIDSSLGALEMIRLKLNYLDYPGFNLDQNTLVSSRRKRDILYAEDIAFFIPYYGCNCLAISEPEIQFFHGVFDTFDLACKHRRVCQTCIENKCIGDEFDWVAHFDNSNGEITCQGDDEDCGKLTCECELDFADRAVNLLMSNKFNADGLDLDSFQFDSICMVDKHLVGNGDSCERRSWFPQSLKNEVSEII